MTIEDDTNKFLHISDCQDKDFPYFDRRERMYDFIQINLKDRILIWSLDKNCLVTDIRDYNKLVSPERFVDCGITLFKTVTKKNSQGQITTKI